MGGGGKLGYFTQNGKPWCPKIYQGMRLLILSDKISSEKLDLMSSAS